MSDDEGILSSKQRRLRVLEEQKAQFGNLCPPHIITEIEDLQREILEQSDGVRSSALPRPPQPDFVHPYPLQANFTGRVRERRLLAEWLSHSTQPILVLIALGGMGKSALSWAWIQHDVLGQPLPSMVDELPENTACRLPEAERPAGVLWWSFYETQASFATFLDEAISYASDRKLNPHGFPSTYDKARVLLNLLQQRQLLLVLDGFERELRAYASLGAAYQGNAVTKEPRGEHRACSDPHAARFLRDAATLPLQSRILITSRLFPRELDDLAGCRRANLTSIDPEDAVTFFHAQGILGRRAEIQEACAPYGYHALGLRLLAGVVRKNRRTPGDIRVASQYPVLSELKGKEQHHILQIAYDALDEQKRLLLSRIATFRSSMTYEMLTIFNEYGDEHRFDAALEELEERGLLFFDREQTSFDLHPIVRSYAYDHLVEKESVHIRLCDYFVTVPIPDDDNIQSIDELRPIIELYDHMIHAGRYDKAEDIYHKQLANLLYFRLGAHHICVELLRALFPDGEEHPPRLQDVNAQIWTLYKLASAYTRSGMSRRAIQLLQTVRQMSEAHGDISQVATTWESQARELVLLGELKAAEESIRRAIHLHRRSGAEGREATSRYELGRVLMHIGLFDQAEEQFGEAFQVKQNHPQAQGLILAYRTQCALLSGNISLAVETGKLAYASAISRQNERDRIRAAWLLGTAQIAQVASNSERSDEELLGRHDTLAEAEKHLAYALTHSRHSDLVRDEPDILLAWAKCHRLQSNSKQAYTDAKEALAIADRCEYRLKQADIHNFLAQLCLDAGNRAEARRHAEIAKERAWCDGPPRCYRLALDEAERLLREIGTG